MSTSHLTIILQSLYYASLLHPVPTAPRLPGPGGSEAVAVALRRSNWPRSGWVQTVCAAPAGAALAAPARHAVLRAARRWTSDGQAIRVGSGRNSQWRSGGYVPQPEQVRGVKPDTTVREPRAAGTNRAITAQRAMDADQGVP